MVGADSSYHEIKCINDIANALDGAFKSEIFRIERKRTNAIWLLYEVQGEARDEGSAASHYEEWQARDDGRMRYLRNQDIQDRRSEGVIRLQRGSGALPR